MNGEKSQICRMVGKSRKKELDNLKNNLIISNNTLESMLMSNRRQLCNFHDSGRLIIHRKSLVGTFYILIKLLRLNDLKIIYFWEL